MRAAPAGGGGGEGGGGAGATAKGSRAARALTSIDSALASSTKPQVLITMASASSWASVMSNPLRKRSPSRTSPSTVFLGQPKDTMDTCGRGGLGGRSPGVQRGGGRVEVLRHRDGRSAGGPARRDAAGARRALLLLRAADLGARIARCALRQERSP